MELRLHPDVHIQKLTIGEEKAPLLVIDNAVSNPQELVTTAAELTFAPSPGFFPGIRVEAPFSYKRFLVGELARLLMDFFQLRGTKLGFSMCHYSLVTTPASALELPQRIPHIDSVNGNGLATVHYLFKDPGLGGTAFYRHRSTGFEYIDESRNRKYFEMLEKERDDPRFPGCDYINGDTPFFERIGAQQGLFNRILVYRRNSLHSGSIDEAFAPDANPQTGRLSINSFIDIR